MDARSGTARQALRMGGRNAHGSSVNRHVARSEALRLLDADLLAQRAARASTKDVV